MASGLGFAEFDDETLALFAIKYLNNMQLVSNKGLIVDYSLEDARALHTREVRLERQKKVLFDKKKEMKKEAKATATPKEESALGTVVDLGKKAKEAGKSNKISIDKITDLELLHQLCKKTISRGKKQRIKKRIVFLNGGE